MRLCRASTVHRCEASQGSLGPTGDTDSAPLSDGSSSEERESSGVTVQMTRNPPLFSAHHSPALRPSGPHHTSWPHLSDPLGFMAMTWSIVGAPRYTAFQRWLSSVRLKQLRQSPSVLVLRHSNDLQ